jgi:hypothetical protein
VAALLVLTLRKKLREATSTPPGHTGTAGTEEAPAVTSA